MGQYRENSYFIRNNGSSSITVTLQVAPADNNNYYVDNSTGKVFRHPVITLRPLPYP
ncbi:DUF6385 domain-containing protein [Desulforamulus ruminis]|uniref:DUF6385 domain-containing protein n=1 Tax=Desulforamulus ruminis TaxID=1564 RepID=UPI003B00F58C